MVNNEIFNNFSMLYHQVIQLIEKSDVTDSLKSESLFFFFIIIIDLWLDFFLACLLLLTILVCVCVNVSVKHWFGSSSSFVGFDSIEKKNGSNKWDMEFSSRFIEWKYPANEILFHRYRCCYSTYVDRCRSNG